MEEFIKEYVLTYLGALFFIFWGIYDINKILKDIEPLPDYIKVRGWFVAIGFIVLGILIIIFKILGKF